MSKRVDKYSKRGIRNSSISTVIGISLVLFMIGLVFGIELHLNDLQKKTKETLDPLTCSKSTKAAGFPVTQEGGNDKGREKVIDARPLNVQLRPNKCLKYHLV